MLRNFRTPASNLRTLSLSSKRAFSHCRPVRNEHHGHEEELGDEEIISKKYYYTVGATGLVFLYYGINSSYASSHDGETLSSKIFTPVTPQEEVIQNIKEYTEIRQRDTDLREAMTIPAPERVFHEFNSLNSISKGSPANNVPGALLNVDNIGPRRKSKSIFD